MILFARTLPLGSTNFGNCHCSSRTDHKSVIFKKLEKVGEPYEFDGHLFQSYHTFEVPIFTENYATVREFGNNSKISIEIKQDKEDMEEKTQLPKEDNPLTRLVYNYVSGKISDKDLIESIKELPDKYPYTQDLKEFNLEAAKQGKPVCTRDGRKARIICFDRDWDMHIVALVSDPLGESVHYYLSNGKVDFDKQNDEDLMMLPEKKEGWVNVYREESNNNERLIEQTIYKTRKDAFDKACPQGYITTTKINWEE